MPGSRYPVPPHPGLAIASRGRLRVAMLAPPWIPVPAPGYGGIEGVVETLCEELVARGHRVTLFAPPGSRSAAAVQPLLERPHPESIGLALFEADHVARAFAAIDDARRTGGPFDVVHDHCGFTALAFADRIQTPLVHTLHGPFTDETTAFYRRHGGKARLIALSEAQRRTAPPELPDMRVIPNPIAVSRWPFRARKRGYLLWMGRMTEVKGAHLAIAAARAAGRPLVLAGPVQPGQEEYFGRHVEPHVDGRRCRYVGEVGGEEKQRWFAEAAGLLMPITWPEPFGMVMVEALTTGTPVIAFPSGAAAEIVLPDVNGFLVENVTQMAAAVRRLEEIDPRRCRASVRARYDVGVVTTAYEVVYREARDRSARPPAPLARLRAR